MQIQSVVIIGAGNVATNLGLNFKNAGLTLKAVYSRNLADASLLAKQLEAIAVNNLSQLPQADLYVIAVADNAIASIVEDIHVKGLVVHTSGITEQNLLNKFTHYGVFYPLQTLNKNHPISLKNSTLIVEANQKDGLALLIALANKISNQVLEINTQQRQYLHLAAVFANNFTNHLLGLSIDILQKHQLPTDILNGLIKHTFEQALVNHPSQMQTGPVVRKDYNTINIHLDLIRNHPDLRVVYETLSNSISKYHHQNENEY